MMIWILNDDEKQMIIFCLIGSLLVGLLIAGAYNIYDRLFRKKRR